MNNKKITLSTHIATLKYSKIYHCCKKLFANNGINYFCYLRRYKDGSMTFLSSEIDVGNYLFEGGSYPYMWNVGALRVFAWICQKAAATGENLAMPRVSIINL